MKIFQRQTFKKKSIHYIKTKRISVLIKAFFVFSKCWFYWTNRAIIYTTAKLRGKKTQQNWTPNHPIFIFFPKSKINKNLIYIEKAPCFLYIYQKKHRLTITCTSNLIILNKFLLINSIKRIFYYISIETFVFNCWNTW